jgi:hypothetical protein
MDIRLSGKMDGMDATYYIFQLFHYPIIFMTSISDEKLLKRVKYSKPYGIIFKPFAHIEKSTSIDLALYNHCYRTNHQVLHPIDNPKNY